MMKMMMRPMPGQAKKEYKFTTPGAAIMDLQFAQLCGPTVRYDAFLVGGAGGKSAAALGYSGGPSMGRAGGGGGGCLQLTGYVKDLAALVPVIVGDQGSTPANAGANAPAPNGGTGGASSMQTLVNTYYAFGGQGGQGGDFSGNSSAGFVATHGIGGAGGGNSVSLGTGGVGGDSGGYSWDSSGTPDGSGSTAATAGTYVGGGTAPVNGGGKGGGGGRPDIPAWSPTSPGAGATGNNTGRLATGSPVSGADGGNGGGADISLFTFDGRPSEIYGQAGVAGRFPQGIVLVLVHE